MGESAYKENMEIETKVFSIVENHALLCSKETEVFMSSLDIKYHFDT